MAQNREFCKFLPFFAFLTKIKRFLEKSYSAARLALARAEADSSVKNMAFVYILKSVKYPKTYVGSTLDLDKRLEEHNSGKSYFTRRYLPWLVVYNEEFENLIDARKREKYFKTAAGCRYIKKSIKIPR